MNEKFNHSSTNDFKLPKNYFQDFETNLLDEIALRKIAPKEATGGFKIPKGYFEKVEAKILATNQPVYREKQVIHLRRKYLLTALSGAAAILIIGLLILKPNTQIVNFGDLATSSLEDYLQQEERFTDIITTTELSEIEENSHNFGYKDYSDEQLLEYLDPDVVAQELIED